MPMQMYVTFFIPSLKGSGFETPLSTHLGLYAIYRKHYFPLSHLIKMSKVLND